MLTLIIITVLVCLITIATVLHACKDCKEKKSLSFDTRLGHLGKDIFDSIKESLSKAPLKTIRLKAPITFIVDTCNDSGFLYHFDAVEVTLINGYIEVFADLDEETKEELRQGKRSYEPDEYWCEGGEWYVEWECLAELADALREE